VFESTVADKVNRAGWLAGAWPAAGWLAGWPLAGSWLAPGWLGWPAWGLLITAAGCCWLLLAAAGWLGVY